MDFYLDENIPERIAEGLNYFEGEKRKHNVYSVVEKGLAGKKDVDLFPKIKEWNGIFITNDLKITTRKNEFELLKELGLSVFIVSFKKGSTYWERVNTIMNRWQLIKEIAEGETKPFVCHVKLIGKPVVTY